MTKLDQINNPPLLDTPSRPSYYGDLVDGAATVRRAVADVHQSPVVAKSANTHLSASENPFNRQMTEELMIGFLKLVNSNHQQAIASPFFESNTDLKKAELIEILSSWLLAGFVSRKDLLLLKIPDGLCQLQASYVRMILSSACEKAHLPRITEGDLVAAAKLAE